MVETGGLKVSYTVPFNHTKGMYKNSLFHWFILIRDPASLVIVENIILELTL